MSAGYHETTAEVKGLDFTFLVEFDFHRGEPQTWENPGTGDEVELLAAFDKRGKDRLHQLSVKDEDRIINEILNTEAN